MSWYEKAACKDTDPEMWFGHGKGDVTVQRRLCAGCPVLARCRAEVDAEEQAEYEVHGFWAGETASERMARRPNMTPRSEKPGRKPGTARSHRLMLDYLASIGGRWRGTGTALADRVGLPAKTSSRVLSSLDGGGLVEIGWAHGRKIGSVTLTEAGWALARPIRRAS